MEIPQGLIIEDNSDAQVMCADILELCGVEYDIIANGQHAIEYLSNNVPDILLIDMHLPKVNGVEIIKSIRENPSFASTIVLVLSADHLMSASVEDLVDAVILKPIDVWAVKTLVERFMAHRMVVQP